MHGRREVHAWAQTPELGRSAWIMPWSWMWHTRPSAHGTGSDWPRERWVVQRAPSGREVLPDPAVQSSGPVQTRPSSKFMQYGVA